MPGPALLRLAGHEAVEVARDQRLHHRMLGREGLQQHPPRRLGAAGAAGDLVQQLHRALGGAQIAAGEAEIGVHHADQRQMREMPAFGDDLRADEQIDLARRDRARRLGRGVRAGQRVARHHQAARVGEQRRRFLGDALDAGADGGQAVSPRRRRGRSCGIGIGVAAMVALQQAAARGARPARRCSSGTACGGRSAGTASAARSRGD